MDKVTKIIWTETGISSLENIIDFISKDSEYYASNFCKKVIQFIETLKSFPEIGRIVPEYNIDELRELIYQNYRIIYKISKKNINIVYIGHCTKLLPNIIL